MKVGDKITFFDENKKQFTGTVDALRNPRVNEDGKVTRSNLIDIKVSRMQGVSQIYQNAPLKSDLEVGEKTYCYELLKEQKPRTITTPKVVTDSTKSIKSIFIRKQ